MAANVLLNPATLPEVVAIQAIPCRFMMDGKEIEGVLIIRTDKSGKDAAMIGMHPEEAATLAGSLFRAALDSKKDLGPPTPIDDLDLSTEGTEGDVQ